MNSQFVRLAMTVAISISIYSSAHAQVSTQASYAFGSDYETALQALTDGFNEVCPDTFCEGDYSNLMSMGMTCSVKISTNEMVACTWAFVGTAPEVDPNTGAIDNQYRTLTICKIDVAGVPVQDFLDTINGKSKRMNADGTPVAEGIESVFVGKKASVYDQLTECL